MFVPVASALRCHGLTLTVCLMPPSLPLAALRTCELLEGRQGYVCLIDSLYEAPRHPISTPPPDAALA
jgi:hypothetical protein